MLLLDSEAKEHARLEGYLPNNDFVAALMSGLGRIAFVYKKLADAKRWYGDVLARFCGVLLRTGGDVLAGCGPLQKRPTITRCWVKSPGSFGAPTRPVCGRAKQFSMAALETKQRKRVIVSSLSTSLENR